MRPIHLLSVLPVALALGACTDPTPLAPPAALDRPESVSFFCWNGETSRAVELGFCAPEPDSDDGSPAEPFELHAVVTQTTTGELAAVQITGEDEDRPGVIDSDVRVPGYTFAAVGDVPSAVVTPRSDPAFSYVISRGSGTLHVVETGSFRRGLGAMVTEIERVGGGAFFPAGSRPSAMLLTPDEDELVITLPELGEVWLVPIDGATVDVPVRLLLAADLPAPVDLSVPGVEQPPSYEYTCGLDAPSLPAPAAPREPVSLGLAPEPWGLALDAEAGHVLVADRALPIIHVIDLATRAELASINVAVPTRELALTPRVPARPGETERTERFLYAVDELDQSVLAVDYTNPARASFGAVLTVTESGRGDRLDIPFETRAIEVVTPGYAETGALAFCTSSEDSAPSALHGVFLAVATTDGRVRIVDVFDLDTPCRGAGCGSADPDDDDVLVAIGRHRPRVGAFMDELIALDPAPTWESAGASTSVTDNGAARDLPTLLELDAGCPGGLGPVFPAAGARPRVCVVTDPWAAVSQRFTASYEGALPFTATTGGNFAVGEDAVEVRFDPCARGVLGREDVPASGDLANYGGDVIAITGALPPSIVDDALRETCEGLVQETAGGETTPILLPILQASASGARPTYRGRLVVGDPINVAASLAEVRQCFPELLELEVRARGAFVVESTRAGFRHPVVTGASGRCEVDSARSAALERGRALPGQVFQTPEVAFLLESVPPGERRPVLRLSVSDVPPALSFDISRDGQADLPSLIAELEYNDVDSRLYVIDQARRGLVRMDLTEASQPIEAVFR